jgi:hypothetical protein
VLTALLLVGAYVVPSAVGSNASRMPLLFAVPVVAAAARLPRVPLALAVVLVGLFPADQLRDDLSALDASRTTPEYYAPLLAALDAEPLMRTHRVEIVEPRDHWHAARVAPRYSLARGWQRQADVERTTPLYRPEPLAPAPLTAQAYRAWLDEYAVAVVAVAPDAPVDFASVQERTLVLGGLPYLEDAGRHGAWQVFRVRDPAPMATGVAEVVGSTDDAVLLRAGGAGSAAVRVRWSPYLVVSGGPSGARAVRDGNFTRVEVPAAGDYRLHARFRPLPR